MHADALATDQVETVVCADCISWIRTRGVPLEYWGNFGGQSRHRIAVQFCHWLQRNPARKLQPEPISDSPFNRSD
jgi:hypothetical protein